MLHSFTFTSHTPDDTLFEGFVVSEDKDPGCMFLYIQNYKIRLTPILRGIRAVWSFSDTPINIECMASISLTVETDRDCTIYQRYKRKRHDNQCTSGEILESCTVEEIVQVDKPSAYKNCSSSSIVPIDRSMSWYISPVSKKFIVYPSHAV
jgi:hypothetical protein